MLISRRNEKTNWRRTKGFYGHLPNKNFGRGYLRYVGEKNMYTFWYMGNPYRHKIFEKGMSFIEGGRQAQAFVYETIKPGYLMVRRNSHFVWEEKDSPNFE